jgi:hypothetical protein
MLEALIVFIYKISTKINNDTKLFTPLENTVTRVEQS